MLPKRELAFSIIAGSFHVFFCQLHYKGALFLIESIHREGAIQILKKPIKQALILHFQSFHELFRYNTF